MLKPKVLLSKGIHKECEIIKIGFEKNSLVLERLRQMRGLRWSKTLACWYVPLNSCPHGALYNLLKDIALVSFSKENKPFYENRETLAALKNYEQPKEVDCKEVTSRLTPEHYLKLENFKMWLQSKRYSANTIATYIQALSLFLRYFSEKTVEAIDNTDLISFNNNYILQHKLSCSFQNQVVNAVKLFFTTVENKKIQPQLIHRPKRAKVLPNVLSKEEVKALLAAPLNIKHKTMLSLIYACGLRCGELIRLTPTSVDANRHLLIIKQSKGRKDRIVPLSDKILMLLRDYYQICKPKTYLFEGQKVGEMYDERSLQQVLKNSVIKAKIQKPVTLHWLRHSYATHLLENGTDLRYIQEILGHSSSRTTEIYTHVSNKSIQKIVSPFDYL